MILTHLSIVAPCEQVLLLTIALSSFVLASINLRRAVALVIFATLSPHHAEVTVLATSFKAIAAKPTRLACCCRLSGLIITQPPLGSPLSFR